MGAMSNSDADTCRPLSELLEYIPIGKPDQSISEESRNQAINHFQVRPTDVICATFPKTGTTCLTWICHLLRSACDTEFESIYEICPWPLFSWDVGYDPNVSGNKYSPRVFKSHLRLASVFRGCKYIVVVRDPAKVIVSFYNFLRAKKTPAVAGKDVDEFLVDTPYIVGSDTRASLWQFYFEFYQCRNSPDVMVLVYEDLVKNKTTVVRQIAKFMNVDASPDIIDRVVNLSTKEAMKKFGNKFDEPYERGRKLGRIAEESALIPASKVVLEPHKEMLSEASAAYIRKKWEAILAPLGFPDYESMASFFRNLNEQRYGTQP